MRKFIFKLRRFLVQLFFTENECIYIIQSLNSRMREVSEIKLNNRWADSEDCDEDYHELSKLDKLFFNKRAKKAGL